jgi:hypothetical protein
MKLPLSTFIWILLALLKISSAQDIVYPKTDYYGEQQPAAQDANTPSTEGQGGEGYGQTGGYQVSDQTDASNSNQGGDGGQQGGGGEQVAAAPSKAARSRPPRVRGPAADRHKIDYTQPDPNPYNNEYPCQGPWYECVGMDKNDCFAYIKERLKYCGDTETKVLMYPKSEGVKNRVFVHVNSAGAITKAAAA